MVRDRCLRVGGIDLMAAAEECIGDALVHDYAADEIYGLAEFVPTDLLGNEAAERGVSAETSDGEIVVAFSADAVAARRLERRIERQQRAELERQGLTLGPDVAVADLVRATASSPTGDGRGRPIRFRGASADYVGVIERTTGFS